jgi:hypothetical protein
MVSRMINDGQLDDKNRNPEKQICALIQNFSYLVSWREGGTRERDEEKVLYHTVKDMSN